MSATNDFETKCLALYFNGTTHANLADNTATSPATTLTLSLHTADPGEAGDMTTNEATYTAYARQTSTRGVGDWVVSGNVATLQNDISFPEATGGSEVLTHFGIGTGVSDNLMFKGEIDPDISVSSGVTPILKTGTTVTLD